MAGNWRILDFTSLRGSMRFNKKTRMLQVVVSESGEVSEYCLDDVNLLFVGIYVSLAPAVMEHIAKHDVVVVFCDWKGLPSSSIYPWIDAHGRVAARQRAQASLSEPRSKNAWMRIVKAKVKGQANNLNTIDDIYAKKVADLSGQVRSGDPANIEAQAARLYWSRIFQGESFFRIPGERKNGRNSLLDYGYTILRGHSMRAVLSAGLTPALGVFHKGRSNLFALADDLIEPFRPAIDFAVTQLPECSSLEDQLVKMHLLNAACDVFSDAGFSIPTVMTDLAQQYGLYVEGELSHLEVPVWRPEKWSK